MTPPFPTVPVKHRIVMMLGDFVSLIPKNVLIYGAGHYSFFNNYDGTCNAGGGPENCQLNIVDLEGTLTNIDIYNLNTVGSVNMISEAGNSLAVYSDNVNVFPDCIALFQLAAGSGGSGTGPTTTSSVPTTLSTRTSTSTAPTGGSSGWTLLGCYTDNVNGRSLPNGVAVPGGAGAMTVELCQSTCKGLGYILAGVEYADECYCGNSIVNGGAPAPDGNALCDMACAGNAAETCGGPNRLDLYSYGSGGTAPTSTKTSTSASATATSSAGWNFRGCYTDSVAARSLSHGEIPSGGAATMTIEACQSLCQGLGYTLAGLEYADECYCDNALQNGGTIAPDGNAQCNMKCAGNTAETCGGPNRLDLYSYGYGNGTAIP